MPNGIDLATVQNLVNALIVFVFAMLALFTAGGVGAFVAVARQNKRNLELAYEALPPTWQQTIREIITQAKGITDLADDIITPDGAPTPITPTASVQNPPTPEA